MFRNILIIIGIVILAAAGFIAYGYFFASTPDAETVTMELGEDFVGKPIIDELERIRNLKIDGTLFSRASYQTLVDRTVEVQPEPVGRDNPFAVIGAGVASVVTVGSTTAR